MWLVLQNESGSGYEFGDDGIVPSTPTLQVPQRSDGFAEAVWWVPSSAYLIYSSLRAAENFVDKVHVKLIRVQLMCRYSLCFTKHVSVFALDQSPDCYCTKCRLIRLSLHKAVAPRFLTLGCLSYESVSFDNGVIWVVKSHIAWCAGRLNVILQFLTDSWGIGRLLMSDVPSWLGQDHHV